VDGPLQFAKAGSAATLPQQEKKNSVDLHRGDFNSPTQKRAEGRPPVWGFEFTTKVATYRGDS
jgi:hypothetical protein